MLAYGSIALISVLPSALKFFCAEKFKEASEFYKSLGDKKDGESGTSFEW